MKARTKNILLDVAAELIVSPITAYVKIRELKTQFDESESGQKTKEAVKKASVKIKETATTVANSEAAQKVKDTAAKLADSEAAQKSNDIVKKVGDDISQS